MNGQDTTASVSEPPSATWLHQGQGTHEGFLQSLLRNYTAWMKRGADNAYLHGLKLVEKEALRWQHVVQGVRDCMHRMRRKILAQWPLEQQRLEILQLRMYNEELELGNYIDYEATLIIEELHHAVRLTLQSGRDKLESGIKDIESSLKNMTDTFNLTSNSIINTLIKENEFLWNNVRGQKKYIEEINVMLEKRRRRVDDQGYSLAVESQLVLADAQIDYQQVLWSLDNLIEALYHFLRRSTLLQH